MADADLGEQLWLQQRQRDRDQGRPLFLKYCATCHGRNGDGKGPSAKFMNVMPRDFIPGKYKFRMTPSGELPRVADVYRTITMGVLGTHMPRWRNVLSDKQRWLLARYVMSLSNEFEYDEEEEEEPVELIELVDETPNDIASVARGAEQFIELKCTECHGTTGRGDGPAAATTLDEWGNGIDPADLTRGYVKGGIGPKVLYRTVSSGLQGTPMPGYADLLSPEQRWDLVHYIQSLAPKPGFFESVFNYVFRDPAGRMNIP